MISLIGLEKSFIFSTFLFLFVYFKCCFCTSDTTASQSQWLLSFCKVLLRNVVLYWSNMAEKGKITNDSLSVLASKVNKRGSKKAELLKKS